MNNSQRDGLLVRLEERSCNIWKTLEELKAQQIKQNGFIQDNNNRSIKNTAWRRAHTWVIGGIGTALAIGLTHLEGLW